MLKSSNIDQAFSELHVNEFTNRSFYKFYSGDARSENLHYGRLPTSNNRPLISGRELASDFSFKFIEKVKS